MDYSEFLEKKSIKHESHGFDSFTFNDKLFDFQKAIVKWALKKGRAAIFADTGLGKTFMQCEWAHQVSLHTDSKILIVAPLCVAKQTVEEADKFGIKIKYCRQQSDATEYIHITNYEMLDKFDATQFEGVVLDESSILKHQDSKTRRKIIDMFQSVPFRLSCTATPSPNDFMEFGGQSEFLGIMSSVEMLATYFIHDGGETSKWRLKGHGKTKFFEWLSTWAVLIRKPSDIGFSNEGYDLPPLNIVEHVIKSGIVMDGELFSKAAESLQERRTAQRKTINLRVDKAAEIANRSNDSFVVWCALNEESEKLTNRIINAEQVTGSDSIDQKESTLLDFSHSRLRAIVTKPSIAGFGLNWQHCNNMIFANMSDSFEDFYQAVRRCYRFGQTKPVTVHLITTDIEANIKANIEKKQKQHDELSEIMVSQMRDFMKKEISATTNEKVEYVEKEIHGNGYDLYLSDCVELAQKIKSDSIHYSIFSPPFASLYTYSNSDRDMGNCKGDEEFYDHFKFLVKELHRIIMPGRLVSFHCMNLPTSKQNHGYIGIRDFRGELIRLFQDAGFIYHSEVCIWKDPVIAMQRTKALGLLHKQLKKDSAMSRQGIPDYLVTMRKPGENPHPIEHTNESFPVHVWQRFASPVWMDINPSKTLQYISARENDDERHICPLQLEIIERGIELWSNPNDLVFSPFTGIGSEGYTALQMGRRFIGSELKKSYFELAARNLSIAKSTQGSLLL